MLNVGVKTGGQNKNILVRPWMQLLIALSKHGCSDTDFYKIEQASISVPLADDRCLFSLQ